MSHKLNIEGTWLKYFNRSVCVCILENQKGFKVTYVFSTVTMLKANSSVCTGKQLWDPSFYEGRWYVSSRLPWPNSKTQFSKKKQCELLLILCFWFLISCPLKSLLIFMKLKVFQGWRGLENQIPSFIIPMEKNFSVFLQIIFVLKFCFVLLEVALL